MKRKRIVYCLVTILLMNLVGSVAVSAKITDVPVDHWAYHAVNTAINKGYLTIFEDGTFQGSRSVDRYTLANVIGRLLEEIEVARVKGTSGDLSLIRELSLEFEADLTSWYAEQQTFRDDLQSTKQNALAADERLSRVVGAQMNIQEQVEDIESKLVEMQNSMAEFQVGAIDVQSYIGQQTSKINENELRVEELLDAMIQLEEETLLQKEAIKSLENWAGEKGAVFATLQVTDAELKAKIQALGEQNQELQKQLESDIQTLAIRLQRETQKIVEVTEELKNTKEDLALVQTQIITLREDKSIVEDLKKQLGTDVNAQMNAALIREQRLERQIKEIEEEFESYRVTAQKDVKSAKSLATIAIALAAVGAVLGVVFK